MKKPHLFNPIAATAACMITSLLNAALPPAPQWKRDAIMAYWIGEHKGLGPYEIKAIQEQLKLPPHIPLKIINNEVLSFFENPSHCNDDAIEFTLQGAQTGAIINTTGFHTHSDTIAANPFDTVPEEKIINIPSIPVIANIYHVAFNNNAGQRAEQKKLIGSFLLSQEELSDVEAIIINLNYSEIRYKNGNRISGGHC